MDIIGSGVKELSGALAAKEVSSAELVDAYLGRIKSENGELNAVLGTNEQAREEAEAIDARRAAGESLTPLAGIPVLVKDNMLVRGWPATAGSRILENYKAAYDATAVARLRAAGAVVIGRTNMDEFAMSSSGETSHFGATKNPWDGQRIAGGSSSGSAAAVAASLAPLALGSDTGGSVRQPAAMCGVTGLKPTYGRVSRYGLMAMASSLDQIGPLCRSVHDAAMCLEAIEGEDPYDATSTGDFEKVLSPLLEPSVDGLRVGLPKEYFAEGLDPAVKAAVEEAIKRLEAGGAEVVEISLPHTEYALAAYYVIMPSEVSSNMARYDGVRYGYRAGAQGLMDMYRASRGQGFGTEVKRRIMLGTYVLSAGYHDAYYRKALKARTLVRRDFDEAFARVDVIASPTAPTTAWNAGEKFDNPVTMYLSDVYTISANLAGIPALSMPCGIHDGLPIGFQLMGPRHGEYDLLRAGAYYQSVTDWHNRTPA